MKIRTDQGELAEQIRRLVAEANPSLSRFRGLGTSVAVQKAPVAKPPAQSSNSGTLPRPLPQGPPAQGSTPRPTGTQPAAARPSAAQPSASRPLPNTNPDAGLLLEPFASLGQEGSNWLDPHHPASAPSLGARLEARERNPQTRLESRAAPERLIEATLTRPAARAETSPVDAKPRPLEPRTGFERLPPLELSADQSQLTNEPVGRLEPRAPGERAERAAGEAEQREPRELARVELRGGAELKPRLDPLAAGQPSRLDPALPTRIDGQSAAELQTLIALHAKTGAPYATALAEIRASASKTQRRAGKPAPTHDERPLLARRARVRAYVVLGALLGLFLVLTLAKACSGS